MNRLVLLLIVSVIFKLAWADAKEDLPVVYATFSCNGDFNQGLYWAGLPGDTIRKEKSHFGNSGFEHLIKILTPGSSITERIADGHSIIVRSADLMSRVRLTLSRNKDSATSENHPYSIRIVNLSTTDRDGPFPIELVHGDPNEYIWIDPFEFVEHITGPEHIFQLRSKDHSPLFTIAFRSPTAEEL